MCGGSNTSDIVSDETNSVLDICNYSYFNVFFKIVTLDFLYLHNTHWGVIFIPIRYKLDSFLETAQIFLNLKKIRILNILNYINYVSIDRLDPIDTRFCVDAVYERTHGIC